jgi:hypothetical protein
VATCQHWQAGAVQPTALADASKQQQHQLAITGTSALVGSVNEAKHPSSCYTSAQFQLERCKEIKQYRTLCSSSPQDRWARNIILLATAATRMNSCRADLSSSHQLG